MNPWRGKVGHGRRWKPAEASAICRSTGHICGEGMEWDPPHVITVCWTPAELTGLTFHLFHLTTIIFLKYFFLQCNQRKEEIDAHQRKWLFGGGGSPELAPLERQRHRTSRYAAKEPIGPHRRL